MLYSERMMSIQMCLSACSHFVLVDLADQVSSADFFVLGHLYPQRRKNIATVKNCNDIIVPDSNHDQLGSIRGSLLSN